MHSQNCSIRRLIHRPLWLTVLVNLSFFERRQVAQLILANAVCSYSEMVDVVDMGMLSLPNSKKVTFDSLPESWQIPLSSVKIFFRGDKPVLLGKGGFGMVFHAKVRQEQAAIKMVQGGSKKEQARLLHEIMVLERCKTIHVVQFLGYSISGSRILLCMEFLPGGTVWESLRKDDEFQWYKRYILVMLQSVYLI